MVQGPFTKHEAARVCGCDPEDLCVGAMAGTQEPDKVRTIFDASIIGVNDNIRANTDKKTTAPTLYDLLTARLHLTQGPLTLFKSDASKAHRRIKVQKKDWKYMMVTIKHKFWVNMLGTYGVASAQLYWGRLAARLTRLSYHLTPDLLWLLFFVDDFIALLGQNAAEVTSEIPMLFFTLLGCPIKWHKNVLHPLNRWLGYMVDINEATVWLPEDKLTTLLPALGELEGRRPSWTEGGDVSLGQTPTVAKAFPAISSHLQPLYSLGLTSRPSGHFLTSLRTGLCCAFHRVKLGIQI